MYNLDFGWQWHVVQRWCFYPVQVMLRQDNGQYACIAEDERRYNLGEAKEEMMATMGLDTEEEGSALQFLRRGYKVQLRVLSSLAEMFMSAVLIIE